MSEGRKERHYNRDMMQPLRWLDNRPASTAVLGEMIVAMVVARTFRVSFPER